MTVEFTEVDFQALEGDGRISFFLNVMGSNAVDLTLMITPYTFEEYQTQTGMMVPDTIANRAEGVDRAEGEL